VALDLSTVITVVNQNCNTLGLRLSLVLQAAVDWVIPMLLCLGTALGTSDYTASNEPLQR
jgi:hypothetical protein